MRIRDALLSAALPFAAASAGVSPAAAQDVPPPAVCRAQACGLVLDWGSEGTPTFVDRRYGSISEFEQRVIAGLTTAGYRFITNPAAETFRIRLRPRIATAMCDRVPGTDPDMSCRTINDLTADFINADPVYKLPANLRIRNRCGSDMQMDIERFSQYVAAMLDYAISQDKDRKRPTARC
ncbi:MAG: hypothetical protein A2W29_11545 [Gemmatimonadetes bacterium RBG_16_66_8]|nr:MAG: hypothetical protein A2W29_11545 [Gemmatimonadetes bacterium RBG_16_66_8]